MKGKPVTETKHGHHLELSSNCLPPPPVWRQTEPPPAMGEEARQVDFNPAPHPFLQRSRNCRRKGKGRPPLHPHFPGPGRSTEKGATSTSEQSDQYQRH